MVQIAIEQTATRGAKTIVAKGFEMAMLKKEPETIQEENKQVVQDLCRIASMTVFL